MQAIRRLSIRRIRRRRPSVLDAAAGLHPGLPPEKAPPPETPNPQLKERDVNPSRTTRECRWARFARRSRDAAALFGAVWILLPGEVRELLIHLSQA